MMAFPPGKRKEKIVASEKRLRQITSSAPFNRETTSEKKIAVELYGEPSDPFTKMVLAYLKNTGRIECKLVKQEKMIECNSDNVEKKSAFQTLKSFRKVPVLWDGHCLFSGSRDIIMKCAKLGENEQKQKEVEEWLQTEEPELNALLCQRAFAECLEKTQGEKIIKSSDEELKKKLYDKKLSDSKLLAGKPYSIDDLMYLRIIEFIVAYPYPFEKKTNIRSWDKKISKIPE